MSNLAGIIKSTNEMIAIWDMFEEYRELSIFEQNGREVIKENLLKMLSYQRIYWKQRANIRSLKFGDENSQKFKAKATNKYRHNCIFVLQDDLGMNILNTPPKLLCSGLLSRIDLGNQFQRAIFLT